jgi:hypothetical protein
MSTKNNPGAFRCYEAALPDEHIFVILARDPAGPATLRFWADERERVGKTVNPDDIDRLSDARRDADLMQAWRDANLDPMGDGSGPSWKMVRITDDDGGPIRSLPENVQYVAAERDGDEAVRLNVDWFKGRVNALTRGEISREQFADLMMLACASPQRQRPEAIPANVYWCDEGGNFYDSTTHHGMGVPFYRTWCERRSEFPGDPRVAVAEDPPVAERTVRKEPALGMPYGRNETAGERLVIDTDSKDIAHAPEVPPHRFSMFHKGERYAYARGLEINPTHLPVALDAMALDGWYLLAIFGQTDSQHVGFIFERREPVWSAFEIAHGFGGPTREELERLREGPSYQRFMAGEPLDDIRADDTPVAESEPERFVVEYVERIGQAECRYIRVPNADWPEWAIGCGPEGMGRGLEP